MRSKFAPAGASCADYEAAARLYADRVLGLREVQSVFQFGRLNAPGVSDLDLLVLIQQTPKDPMKLSASHVFRENKRFLSLMLHDVAVVETERFADLPLIYHVSHLRRLGGEAVSAPRCPYELRHFTNAANLLDFAVPRIHRLAQAAHAGACPLVQVVLASAAVHSCTLLELLGQQTDETLHFREYAADVRNSYSKGIATEEDVVRFVRSSRDVLVAAVSRVVELLGISAQAPLGGYFHDRRRDFITIFSNRKPRIADNDHAISRTEAASTWRAPSSLYWYFHAYSLTRGMIGRRYGSEIFPRGPTQTRLPAELFDFITLRANKMGQRLQFLESGGLLFSDLRP